MFQSRLLLHSRLFLVAGCIATTILIQPLYAQPQLREIKEVGKFSGSGQVEEIQPGEITIRSDDGKRKSFLIQNKDERFISLDGNDYIVSMPAKIKVTGRLAGDLLEQGMIVKFRGEINRGGRTGEPIKDIEVISGDKSVLKLDPLSEPTGRAFVPCDFIGIIQRVVNDSIYLVVPRTRMTPTERVSVKVSEEAWFDIESDSLDRVRDGDQVVGFKGVRMANRTMVIREIEVKLTAVREVATPTFSEQLFQKYSKLPDSLVEPREERSEHFVLYTDISPRSARVLLEKLETMYGFLARYYRKKPRDVIECYVVADIDKFRGKIPPVGVARIEEKAGVTASQQWARMKGDRVKAKRTVSIVYSCDDHNVVQHEAVHAYCNMAFGTAGPVWYAEGMAEIGNYWAPEQNAVRIEPVVIEYLTKADPKKMLDIVAAGQITGDSWKAYAWRWALCHLFYNNPNYSKRFRELGMNLMMEKPDSFDKAFGKMSDQISFEYDQFVTNFDNGYRADLCVWEWPDEAKKIEKRAKVEVAARQGWQATSLLLDKSTRYDFICPEIKNEAGKRVQQTWKLKQSQPAVSPAGNSRGEGMLIGAILHDYKLSEPFELGSKKAGFAPPESGQLYVRCREKWSAIADNEGQIKVYIRKSPGQ